jgi:tetratricopeptide (TPR) repeat protein
VSTSVDAFLLWVLGAVLAFAPAAGADARDAIQKAAALVQQGRLEDADRQVQPALSDPETQAVAYSILGTIRFQQQRFDDSARFLQKAIQIEPRLVGAQLTLAHVFIVQGKPDLASGLFRRVLELDPSNAAARLALARFETEKGNYRQSLDLAQPALAAFKQSPEGLFILVTNFLKSGNRAAAVGLSKDWTRLPDVPQEWSIKFALLLVNEGAVAESIDVLERARQTSPPSYELALNLGSAYLLNAEPARALDAYDLALTLKPDSLPALRQAAGIAEQRNELERSLSYWMRARKIAAEDPETLLGFGRVCLKMDLLDDAEPALTRAAAMRPEEPVYQYTLAAAKVGKRQFEAAEQLLDGLVKKRPDDPQLQYALGSVFYIQGHLEDAAAHLRESVRLQPEQLASHHYLALIARDQGNDDEAIEILQKLLRRYPDHAPSCEALGSLLMSRRRYTEAETNLRAAVRLNPKSVKANYQLGLLLARMGKKEEADRQLELAKTLRHEDEATSRLQLRLLEPQR